MLLQHPKGNIKHCIVDARFQLDVIQEAVCLSSMTVTDVKHCRELSGETCLIKQWKTEAVSEISTYFEQVIS